MKKYLILFAMMAIFAFSCTGVQKNKDKTDETEMDNPFMDSKKNDIFENENKNDTISTSNDSIKF